MRRYRNVSKRDVEGIEPGKEGELDLTVEEEAAHVAAGRLELLPREYEVVGPRVVFGNKPGDKFEMAMTMGQEALAIEGGQIAVAAPTRKRKADRGD